MTTFDEIFQRLGLDRQNGLYVISEGNWKTDIAFPNRVKRLIERKIKPYAVFCFDNKPLLLFFDTPTHQEELHKSIWNFNECPIAIILNNNVVEVYNGFNYSSDTKLLAKIGGIEKLTDFGYFELVTGKTWKDYQEQLNYKNRVDYQLLENIKAARKLLLDADENKARIANAILGKVIFVRYLIDRKVKMKVDGKLREWQNAEFCELLNDSIKAKEFFDYLEDDEKGFNGDLFPLTSDEYAQITYEDFQVLRRLLSGEDIESGQPSLFEFYDFSILPIEFISNIYELFIGQDNQKKEGAYYTPLFLVDYILKETVENKLSQNGSDYNCKVLDPACGSGIFLVETLRKIIEKYIAVSDAKTNTRSFKTAIAKLVKDNIFGVDKDKSAVQVAIFSIYLTMLDYLEPAAIEDAFKFPNLLNTNFFEADFFDTDLPFNKTLQNKDFDFILGNPPWKGNGMDETGNLYLKNRKNKEKTENKKFPIAINNNEIAEGFVLRASDFSKEITQISFIIRSSSLYNLGYNDENSPFRQYWLEEYFIDKVFELAPVRREVFEKSNKPAIAPAAVIFYRYADGQETDSNLIEHIALKQSRFFSLFKIFTINRNDYKKIEQKKLKQFDWLWKVLVYGSYLDFNFIKRLKEEYEPVKRLISNETKFVVSTGLHSRTKPLENPKDLSPIENFIFLKTESVESFYIDYRNTQQLRKENIDIIKDIRIYRQPMLLIREGIEMSNITSKCAISRKDVIFKGSITSIKVFDDAEIGCLEKVAAIITSSLFTYYSINLFTTVGIERERVTNYNKFSLPYLDVKVSENVRKIEQAKLQIHAEEQDFLSSNRIQQLEEVVNSELEKINHKVLVKLELDNAETALINYALDVSRTLITGDERQKNMLFYPLGFEDEILRKYANIFVNRFKTSLDTPESKFTVEIWHTDQIIGMFFKMIPANEYRQEITWISKQNNAAFLTFLLKVGVEKITDQLFVQKDIRGFDNNGNDFYIIKPNEKRLWHEAIAYLDVNDFADAILKAGRETKDV